MSGKVLILHTGGTLGMRPRHPDRALAPDEFGATVLEHVPELERIASVDTRMLYNLDSSDMAPEHWSGLAKEVYEAREDYDGVVITHGTDAMVYTASALSYMLRDLSFPVILTGSQRPLNDVHTDGRANLVGAVDLALHPIPEVAIYFDGLLLRGNRAIKYTTFAFGAFSSLDFPPLAEVGTEVKLIGPPLQASGEFHLRGDFDRRVAVAWLHPGDDAAILRGVVDSEVRAVLIVAFGYGNVPVANPKVGAAIEELVQSGKVVAIGSQSPKGSVNLSRYAGGRLAQELGAVGIGDMTLPAATVKLMYLCAIYQQAEEVRRALLEPIAGEITV